MNCKKHFISSGKKKINNKCKLLFSKERLFGVESVETFGILYKKQIYIFAFCDDICLFKVKELASKLYFERAAYPCASFSVLQKNGRYYKIKSYLLKLGSEKLTRRTRKAARYILKQLDYLKYLC